jgi:hypothetical protein
MLLNELRFCGFYPFLKLSGQIETPMRPGRGSHVTDGKQHLSTLKISFPWETQATSQCLNTLNKLFPPSARAMKGPRILGKAFKEE